MENNFVNGLFVKSPRENAPQFVKADLSILVEKFIAFLQESVNDKGYVNFQLLESKEGKLYAKLNSWNKEKEVKEPF